LEQDVFMNWASQAYHRVCAEVFMR